MPLAAVRHAMTWPGSKSLVQRGVGGVHRRLLSRELPRRIAIYFHELEPHQHPSFLAAMRHLQGLGYRAVGPDAYAAGGGDRLLFVSFDDNYRSWHGARRVLDEAGVSATFYVNTLPFRDRCTAHDTGAYFDRIAFGGGRQSLSTAELAARRHGEGQHGRPCRRRSRLRAAGRPQRHRLMAAGQPARASDADLPQIGAGSACY
jgi:hypothetical protein